ncbi:hypothetical protein [Mycobacterium sp. TY814]|uniref:hypothetical protein n=1 Tax=Mycobacterium sp. TY814 TaxID=3050580 RepID=UPI002740E956|nr:hypothetical protein [Mycobacterium sp. TY814]MDP7724547.1 hypothetical protein [Mycobacterium sp. TY814]
MTPDNPPRTLEDEVRRLRAGIVRHPPSTRDPRESEMVRVVSAASLAWDGQFDRVDRFSRPLLPSSTSTDERASPAMTAHLFLEQVASDYRRVASCQLDLRDVEARRTTDEGTKTLERCGVASRPVAPLAVGQHLAVQRAGKQDLASVFEPWIATAENADRASQYAAAFGEVLGPLIIVALDNSPTVPLLPGWSGRVGEVWCTEFLAAGAEILKWPALLADSHLEGRAVPASGCNTVDFTETANEVVAVAQGFRPVTDVRVSAAGAVPRVELVLAGDGLTRDELTRFVNGIKHLPAEVAILP